LRFTNITYLRTWEGWPYLATVQDAFSRRIRGQMADHMRHELVAAAVQMAVNRRRPEPGLIHHSDGGFNWLSQRLIEERCYGKAEGLGISDDGTSGGVFAGSGCSRRYADGFWERLAAGACQAE
jgi:hypothetical protein